MDGRAGRVVPTVVGLAVIAAAAVTVRAVSPPDTPVPTSPAEATLSPVPSGKPDTLTRDATDLALVTKSVWRPYDQTGEFEAGWSVVMSDVDSVVVVDVGGGHVEELALPEPLPGNPPPWPLAAVGDVLVVAGRRHDWGFAMTGTNRPPSLHPMAWPERAAPGGRGVVAAGGGVTVLCGVPCTRLEALDADGRVLAVADPPDDVGSFSSRATWLSPDGDTLAVLTFGPEGHDGIMLFDVRSGATRLLRDPAIAGARAQPAWTPDGRLLVVPTRQGLFLAWDRGDERWYRLETDRVWPGRLIHGFVIVQDD